MVGNMPPGWFRPADELLKEYCVGVSLVKALGQRMHDIVGAPASAHTNAGTPT